DAEPEPSARDAIATPERVVPPAVRSPYSTPRDPPSTCTRRLATVTSRTPPCPVKRTEPPNDAPPRRSSVLYVPRPPDHVNGPEPPTPDVDTVPLAIDPVM